MLTLLATLCLLAPLQESAGGPPSRELLLELTRSSRLAGTSGSKTGADFVARVMRAAGFEVEIDEREVLLALPRSIHFQVLRGPNDTHPLLERGESFDPDALPPTDVPKCLGWAKSGSARGPVVDAGYGTRADFERLVAAGIELRGTVALARYGRCYRGIKVDLAAQYGCVAALLFSDPADDGAGKGPVWPEGPWKPDWDAQRGSISSIAGSPGDPSTPGWASPHPGEARARRLSPSEYDAALPSIPAIPIGAAEAATLLANLSTRTLADAKGASSPRPIGPGPVLADLVLDEPRDLRVIRNVIARLPGEELDSVIAGAHRDAWVRGANDDGAGTVMLLRAGQLLGARARAGWKPKNGITLCFWDAEEWGMIGSTEWGEANGAWLATHTIAYVNADANVSGVEFSGLSGTPGMLAVGRAVCERTPSTSGFEGAQNLWEEWMKRSKDTPDLGLPGSGSDFAVFVHHLSLPVLEFGFGGGHGGQYHTTFDDFAFVERYFDPGFKGHEAAASLCADLLGELALRGKPCFDAVEAARTLAIVARAAGAEQKDGDAWLGVLRAGKISGAFEELAAALENTPERNRNLYPGLALSEGLPGRPWYKNPLWAPELENGYASESFPTLRLAARESAAALDAEVDRLAATVRALVPPKR
ncbi:MAG: M28 family peptidase [Planctomycetes bacterium]|nr:M28 family peptidase [Planctomycetota bacterium]